MARLKPWYNVVVPREDLRDNRPLDASEFAIHPEDTRSGRQFRRTMVLLAATLVFGATALCGETKPSLTYQMPPKAIADLVDAPLTPSVQIDPQEQWLLIVEWPSLPSIEELAQPELRLAGLRINPRTNGRSRARYACNLKLKHLATGDEFQIRGLPENARIQNVDWSPDGKHIAFVIQGDERLSLWVADVSTKSAREVLSARLNGASYPTYFWLPDSKSLLCKVVPGDRGEPPAKPTVPSGPVVQETKGKKAPARTYQDLLKNARDEALFEYYLTSQIVRVNLDGERTNLGRPGIIRRAEPAPSGECILVETVHHPFSYLVPMSRFPYRVEIWDLEGNVVRQIADLPLAEDVPITFGAVPTGPRSFAWRPDQPATLYWSEAQDDGDPKKEAEVRDKVFSLSEPFTGDARAVVALELRYRGINWGEENLALVSEWWWQNRRIRTWIIRPDAKDGEKTLLFDYSWQDRYNDPGRPVMKPTAQGRSVLLTGDEGKTLYLFGAGASPEGDRPFFDSLDLDTKETKRLWRSEAPYYESPVRLLDAKDLKLITRRESKSVQPNYFIRDLEKHTMTQITEFPHPTPQLAEVQKELIRYEREDGVKLTATLCLPPGYTPAKDGPLPMLIWAYPTEFKSADAASQVTDSPHRFVRVGWGSPLLWLVHGYAILDDPSMPIVGEGEEEPNDTYVEQLVASARAAVEEVVRRGVAERGRIGIGGHSYGAFMTANLLAHSDLFSAGIARSGAYNRTLTPFGFQAEERTLWQSPDTYFKMSPYMHAHKVNEPILLIHGDADNNSGTFPMQSERFYNAVKGLGGTARLVILPHESHGYRARESIMHMLWEMTNWLDSYVKSAPARTEVTNKAKTPLPQIKDDAN